MLSQQMETGTTWSSWVCAQCRLAMPDDIPPWGGLRCLWCQSVFCTVNCVLDHLERPWGGLRCLWCQSVFCTARGVLDHQERCTEVAEAEAAEQAASPVGAEASEERMAAVFEELRARNEELLEALESEAI